MLNELRLQVKVMETISVTIFWKFHFFTSQLSSNISVVEVLFKLNLGRNVDETPYNFPIPEAAITLTCVLQTSFPGRLQKVKYQAVSG